MRHPAAGAAAAGVLAAASSRPRRAASARTTWTAAAARSREELDEQLAHSLQERTLEALDFDFIMERLQKHCYTVTAAGLAMDSAALLASTPEEARLLYRQVEELALLEDADLQLADRLDIQDAVDQATRGTVLEPSQLRNVSEAIHALLKLRNGIDGAAARGLDIPSLLEIVESIDLPDDLLDMLLEAFDGEGELSEQKFPQIADMRQRIRDLERQCAAEIKNVLASGKYRSLLTDDGYMQLGGQYALSVKPQHKHKVGQVVDESRSGRTVYVQPEELLQFSKELTQLQQELKFAMRRILGQMSVVVSRSSSQLKRCLQVAAQVDLARARLFLGEDMEGEIPVIGDEGIIMARRARNPCLLLRGGSRVVGYRLELGSWSQGLILSGPNAGGKTVVLKTVGLLALLVRCGIPVPAGESPRVDFFQVVLAEVGDMQTIVDDLSTYSAHLVASRIMLSRTASTGARALVMVDEAGSGTDPVQGAALARAIIEALLERGARIVATTHSLQLKNWALADPRTEIAAMEYKEGKPTFHLVRNAVGESYAIETARRLELPQDVVNRAEELLDADQRSLLALQRRTAELEQELQIKVKQAEERELRAAAAEQYAEGRAAALAIKEEELQSAEYDFLARQDRLRSQSNAEFQARVEAHERKLGEILSELKRSSSTGDSRLKIVGNAVQELRLERDAAAEVANVAAQRARFAPGAMNPSDALSMGDWVVVLARTPWYGFKGTVQRIVGGSQGTPGRVVVRLENVANPLEMEKTELGKTSPPQPQAAAKKKSNSRPPRDFSQLVNTW